MIYVLSLFNIYGNGGKNYNSDVRNELFDQLSNSISLRNHEHNTWLTTTFLSLTTSALLLISLIDEGHLTDNIVTGFFITLFGSTVTLFLLIVQHRALITMEVYEKFSKKIEKVLKIDEYSYNKFRDEKLKKFRGKTRFIIELFNYCLFAGWIIFFLIFLIKMIPCN